MKVEQWVQALRSGKYEQTQNALCDGSGFCCLGVLAEAAGVPRETDEYNIINFLFPMLCGDVRSEDAVIPLFLRNKILDDLDLKQRMDTETYEGHTFTQGDLHDRLMTMNDEGLTFDQIATYIEKVAANVQ